MAAKQFPLLGERVAVDLLNTVIAQGGRVLDLLGDAGDVAAWAEAAGIVPHGGLRRAGAALAAEPGDLRRFRERLRRGLVAWAATGRTDQRLVTALNGALSRYPEVLEVGWQARKPILQRRQGGGASPLDRLYGAVARSAAELLGSGDRRRLRKCANPTCRLMFYDVSKGGRRRWCSMQTCGGQAKARAFRKRAATRRARAAPR